MSGKISKVTQAMQASAETDVTAGTNNQYMTFELAGEAYGIDILKVREIKGWEPVREIPNTPPFIRGVLDLRGTLVPIVDLRERFGMETVEYTPVTVVIVLSVLGDGDGDERVMGIVADGVSDVLDVKPETIKKAPDLGAGIDTRYMKGMVMGKQMIMLLDADKLLNPEEFTVLDDIS